MQQDSNHRLFEEMLTNILSYKRVAIVFGFCSECKRLKLLPMMAQVAVLAI
jgi:hypothetical protein